MTAVDSLLPYSPQQVIGQAFGLDPDLLFDPEGHGLIQLDGALLHLQVYQQETTYVLLLLADLGPVPQRGRSEIHQLMLVANSGWRELAGGALCTNESGDRAHLRLRLDLKTINAEVLEQWLTAFVAASENWAQRLGTPASHLDTAGAALTLSPQDYLDILPFQKA